MDKEIESCICDLRSTGFKLTDEGDLNEYLGIQITKLPDGRNNLTQPQLIESIISDLKFVSNTKPKKVPAPATVILLRDEHGEPIEEHWSDRSVIGN